MSQEMRNTVLFGQMQEGLKHDAMKALAVSELRFTKYCVSLPRMRKGG